MPVESREGREHVSRVQVALCKWIVVEPDEGLVDHPRQPDPLHKLQAHLYEGQVPDGDLAGGVHRADEPGGVRAWFAPPSALSGVDAQPSVHAQRLRGGRFHDPGY
ncbi:hypothetical protein BW733_11445 [Tessaracoccus flavescens]|uniref:Uncharacterized protein n=1 Tax=Tessaracoccus flavescens TaxID=399497 RepID=A0A1Q2CZA4_9ACTN|nr:hypothetical protein [Tessaracoccus flavescens]AQP51351.1 hypothetical protein BW733_11445 [Tessaracoccus flavescens]